MKEIIVNSWFFSENDFWNLTSASNSDIFTDSFFEKAVLTITVRYEIFSRYEVK